MVNGKQQAFLQKKKWKAAGGQAALLICAFRFDAQAVF